MLLVCVNFDKIVLWFENKPLLLMRMTVIQIENDVCRINNNDNDDNDENQNKIKRSLCYWRVFRCSFVCEERFVWIPPLQVKVLPVFYYKTNRTTITYSYIPLCILLKPLSLFHLLCKKKKNICKSIYLTMIT